MLARKQVGNLSLPVKLAAFVITCTCFVSLLNVVSYINVSKSTTASVNDIQQSSKDASVDPSLDELRKELGLMRDPDDKLLLVDLKDRTPTKRNIGGSNGGVVTKDLADDNREEMQVNER